MPTPILSTAFTAVLAVAPQPHGDIAKTIHAAAPEINIEVVQRAADALVCEQAKGNLNPQRYAIVDFSLPNTQTRMWIIDLTTGQLLLKQHVSHGSGSGAAPIPTRFSNVPGSNASSPGLYRVSEDYKQIRGVPLDAGPSMTGGLDPYPRARLDGLMPGVNNLARSRAIVMHSSNYVTPKRAGLSQGCFAIEKGKAVKTVEWLAHGQALYADAQDPKFKDYMATLQATCPSVLATRQAKEQTDYAMFSQMSWLSMDPYYSQLRWDWRAPMTLPAK